MISINKIETDYQNYDIAIKDAFKYFENRTLDFLGLNIPRIKQCLNIEFAEIETREDRLDIVFLLENDTILHLEEETAVSRKDLMRFAEYDMKLFAQYGKKIRTVIIVMEEIRKNKTIDCGAVKYEPEIINIMGDKTAELRILEIREQIKKGEKIDEAELAFLPLMKSTKPKVEVLQDGIEILKEMEIGKEMMYKIASIMIVLSDKFVPKKELEKIWEGLKMLKIFQIAEEKGIKKGIEQGIEKGKEDEKIITAEKMLKKNFSVEEIVELTGLSVEKIEMIAKKAV